MTNKLLLTGFMGCGKSTTLVEIKRLAPELTCLDLDELLGGGQETVAQLIARVGWQEFRRLELAQFKELLNRPGSLVVALGGGTLVQGQPLLASHSDVTLVHLALPFAECWRRIQASGSERPLVLQGEDQLRALYEERLPLYQQAHFSVDATQSPAEVALAILQRAR